MVQLLPWPLLASIHLVRMGLTFLVLLIVLPWLIFPEAVPKESSPFVTRAMWALFGMTALVHLLAGIHLYEAIVFLVVCVAVVYVRRVMARGVDQRLQGARFVEWLYDVLDRKRSLWADIKAVLPRTDIRSFWRDAWLEKVLLLGVIGVATWMLFDRVFHSPTPPYSDATINFAWTKYIMNNDLYHAVTSEVYPRGLYAIESLVGKLTAQDAVMLVNFMEPFVGASMLVSMLFFVYKSTRSWGAALVAAVLYGTLPALLPEEFTRRTGAQSQEYGLLFVLPATWYTYAYLRNGSKFDRATAAAAAGMAAFTHPIALLFTLVGMVAGGCVGLLEKGKESWRRLPGLVLWVGGAGFIAALPIGLALLLGLKLHSSSAAYLNSTLAVLPPIDRVDAALVLGLGLVAISGLIWSWVRPKSPATQLASGMAAAAAAAAAFIFIYMLPSFGVNSQSLFDRAGVGGSFGIAIAGALLWALIERLLGRVRPVGAVLLAVGIYLSWTYLPPKPPDAVKYNYYTDEMITAYLRGDASYRRGDWTLVANSTTGYALAFGHALHVPPLDFLDRVQKLPADITLWYQHVGFPLGVTPHYVLVVERKVPLAPDQPRSAATPRLEESAQLEAWIQANKDRLPLVHEFSDDAIDLWVLNVPFSAVDPAAGTPTGASQTIKPVSLLSAPVHPGR